MRLNDLKPNKGAKHRRKRLGSGESSGPGKTCGRGHKGQKSRSGGGVRLGFEGGQMPIFRRLPKKGFNNTQFRKTYAVVNVGTLDARFEDGDTVNETTLREKGIVNGPCDGVKVLGSGELATKLTVEVDKLSGSAREKIEKAGGSITEAAPVAPEPAAPKKKAKEPKASEESAPAPEPEPEPSAPEEDAAEPTPDPGPAEASAEDADAGAAEAAEPEAEEAGDPDSGDDA